MTKEKMMTKEKPMPKGKMMTKEMPQPKGKMMTKEAMTKEKSNNLQMPKMGGTKRSSSKGSRGSQGSSSKGVSPKAP